MIKLVAVLLTALSITCALIAESDVIAKVVISERFLEEFSKATIRRADDIHNVEIQELSPDDRLAVAASLSQYGTINPTVRSYFPPFYPYRLKVRGVSGLVEAILVVSSDGSVREVYLCSYTDIEFAQAAGLALKMWRFKRTAHDYVVRVPIPFTIQNAQPDGRSPEPDP